jgi:hypothetical protein
MKLFRALTTLLLACVLTSLPLNVVLLASDSSAYRGWVYVQMSLLGIAALFLWHIRKFERIAWAGGDLCPTCLHQCHLPQLWQRANRLGRAGHFLVPLRRHGGFRLQELQHSGRCRWCLTIHSSRSRFAARLNSGVRRLGGFSVTDPRERLEIALRDSDDRRRPERIGRMIWLSDHAELPNGIIGRAETLHLLREARETFVDGYFAATLLLAISVVNHSLIEELQLRGAIQGDPGLAAVLSKSEELGIIPVEWLPSIRKLVSRRHPFVHYKDQEHEHGLGSRVALEKSHPTALVETDARDAIEFMYKVFRATLREAA